MVQFSARFGMVVNIPRDPRLVGRDGTKKSRAKSGNSKLPSPDFKRDFFVPSRLIAPESPRMCGNFVIANSSFREESVMILFESDYGTVWVLKSDTNMSECNEVNSH